MICLPDVSVLIALLWPQHESHAKAQRWFRENEQEGWATCAITQSAFVRIVSNPAFSRHAVSPRDALSVLERLLDRPTHRFWADDLPLPNSVAQFGARLLGHQQVTDAYLLSLVLFKRGRLVTFDRSLETLLSDQATIDLRLEIL